MTRISIPRKFNYVNRGKLINQFLIPCNYAKKIAINIDTYRSFNENTGEFEAGAKRDKEIG
jgi:hypothetical protein